MAEFRGDQAEGLRRMLDHHTARIVTLASGCNGVGKTSVVVNLATVLAERGMRVLLIDENHAPASICTLFGLSPRFTLEHVARRACMLEDVLLPAAHGVSVLAAAGAMDALPTLRAAAREGLIADFGSIERRFDIVLVDTPCDWTYGAELLSGVIHDTIVVSSAATRAVTASYALIKRLSSVRDQRRFHVLLNRVELEGNARVILDNLTGVARSHLHMSVESLGYVPRDERLRIADAGFRPVVNVHPSSPSAARFRGIADSIAGWSGASVRPGLIDRFMQRVIAGTPTLFANAGV